MRLGDLDKLYKRIAEQETWNVPDFVYDEIRNAPSVIAVPRGLYEQIRGERDVALSQLKQLNIELFEKPYLKAIPIEWIKNYLAKAPTHYIFVNDLLEDWEAENGKE